MVRVWIADDGPSPDEPGSYFKVAFDLRQVLRQRGWDANIFSVHRKLDNLFDTGGLNVVFPLSERYPHSGYEQEFYGLRKALEELGVPHVGSPYAVALNASDKQYTKEILAANGVSVPMGVHVAKGACLSTQISNFLDRSSIPAVIKPSCNTGGSHGVVFVSNPAELQTIAKREALSGPILIEEYVQGTEVSAWVLGIGSQIDCHSVLVVDRMGLPIYDRSLKTGQADLDRLGSKRRSAPAAQRRELSEDEIRLACKTAAQAHQAIQAYSYSRVDLILSGSDAVVLEVNTHPNLGCKGELSIVEQSRKTYAELMSLLVTHAIFTNHTFDTAAETHRSWV